MVYDVPRFFTSFGGVPAMDVRFKFVRISDFGMFFLLCFCSLCSFHPLHTDILSSIFPSIFQAFFQAIQQAILQAFYLFFSWQDVLWVVHIVLINLDVLFLYFFWFYWNVLQVVLQVVSGARINDIKSIWSSQTIYLLGIIVTMIVVGQCF